MALPHDHHLHYRCVFDLTHSAKDETSWGELVRLVRSWITERVRSEEAYKALGLRWFYEGGEWKFTKNPRLSVRTLRALGSGREECPQFWALRFEHPCEEIAVRQWRTDIGLTALEQGRYTFTLSIIHWLIPGYFGNEPSSPIPSAPFLVTSLLRSSTFRAQTGTEELTSVPFLVRDGGAQVFLRYLTNPSRACPVVLVAKDFQSGRPLVDPARLAKLLAGAALVFESESSWVDKELESLLPQGFRCWNGMVRIYQPRPRLDVPADSTRHRYFSNRNIQEMGAGEVEEQIVRGVVRRSRVWNPHGVASIEDVASKAAELKLSRLGELNRGSTEWADLLEAENARLTQSVFEKDEEISQWVAQVEEMEGIKDDCARLEYERNAAASKAQEAEEIRSALAARAAVLQQLEKLPTTVIEVVHLIRNAYPDRVDFTEKALESAKSAKLRKFNIAWECLKAMATTLYELHFTEKLQLREIVDRFKNSSGFELAVGESETTKQNKRLAALRRDKYKGETVDMSFHVKYGNSPGNSLRVHYYPHQTYKLLIIGHCGDHLDTSRTN